MYKLRNKRNHGITLIALVITIIVLLILAGISIQMLTGDNSILSQAGRARDLTGEKQIEEKVYIAVNGTLTNGLGKLNYDNLNSEIAKQFKDYEVEPKSNADSWTITVTENGIEKNYIIKSTGEVQEVEESDICIITKVYENKTTTQKVKKGNITGLITYEGKEGYYFAGWSKDANDFSTRSKRLMGNVTEDITVYPVYISNNYLKETKIKTAGDNVYVLSAVDSNIYKNVGFEISINGGEFAENKGTMTKSLNANGSIWTSESEFNVDGYLINKDLILNNTNLSVNSEIIFVPYYVTYDGVKVKGKINKYLYKETGFEKIQ